MASADVFTNEVELFKLMEDNRGSTLEFSFYTEEELDNYESMAHWLEANGLDEFVIEDEKSLVVLKHPNFEFEIEVQSYGEGDFHDHGISCAIIEGNS